jgi:hypothetical protein
VYVGHGCHNSLSAIVRSKCHNNQILLGRLVVKARKGSGIAEGLLSKEGVHFLGWDRLRGMRGCEVELLLELVP